MHPLQADTLWTDRRRHNKAEFHVFKTKDVGTVPVYMYHNPNLTLPIFSTATDVSGAEQVRIMWHAYPIPFPESVAVYSPDAGVHLLLTSDAQNATPVFYAPVPI